MSDKRKRAVRERMALTGENYTTAQRNLFALWDAQDAARGPDEHFPLVQDRPLLSEAEATALAQRGTT